MPSHDDFSPTDAPGSGYPVHSPVSRRSVLRGAATAGAAGIAASALAGLVGSASAADAAPSRPAESHRADTDSADQIVVHIRDIRSGHLDVLRGTSQTQLHDPEIVARLVRASHS